MCGRALDAGVWGDKKSGAIPVRAFAGNSDAFAAKLDSSGALVWNTFLGGNDFGDSTGVAVDGSGNVYVAGSSATTWGSPVRAFVGGFDGFAAKLNSSGALTWNTFLGSSSGDQSFAVVVDGSGNVYVAGSSSATWGAPIRAYTSETDAFAAKLSSSGALTWNTFLGGSGYESGYGIAVGGSGNVYLAGTSSGTWGTPIRAYTGDSDAFAAKMDSGGALLWNTFLGGALFDNGNGIAVDGSENVYVAGESHETWGTPVRAFSGGGDGFAAKLDSSGALTWHAFLGGVFSDRGLGIAVDGSGNVYAVGSGGVWGTPIRPYTFGGDAYAAKLGSDGALTWNTFLGGSAEDNGYGIAVDGGANVYVTGRSRATWSTPIRKFIGFFDYDAFVGKIPAVTSCAEKPDKPSLIKPSNLEKVKGPKVKLDWGDTACPATYEVIVRQGSKTGPIVLKKEGLTLSEREVKSLSAGVTYYWRVTAKNSFGKIKSLWFSFTVK